MRYIFWKKHSNDRKEEYPTQQGVQPYYNGCYGNIRWYHPVGSLLFLPRTVNVICLFIYYILRGYYRDHPYNHQYRRRINAQRD